MNERAAKWIQRARPFYNPADLYVHLRAFSQAEASRSSKEWSVNVRPNPDGVTTLVIRKKEAP